MNNQFEEYDMVFLILNEDDKYKGKTEIWQQGNYACLRFKGSHKDAPEHYKKLIEFIDNHNILEISLKFQLSFSIFNFQFLISNF